MQTRKRKEDVKALKAGCMKGDRARKKAAGTEAGLNTCAYRLIESINLCLIYGNRKEGVFCSFFVILIQDI